MLHENKKSVFYVKYLLYVIGIRILSWMEDKLEVHEQYST